MLFLTEDLLALSWNKAKFGMMRAKRIPMIKITTNNSINVKPFLFNIGHLRVYVSTLKGLLSTIGSLIFITYIIQKNFLFVK